MNRFRCLRAYGALIGLTLLLGWTFDSADAGPTRQSEPDFAAIDAYLSSQRQELGIPGLALGIVDGDRVVHLQGFGVADASGRPVTPQTPFYLASLTKPFTALAVMQLVEAGKVELDAPVQAYLPWFRLADEAASAQITVRHLLNQTSGFTRMDGDLAWTRQGAEAVAAGLKTLKPSAPVGTTYLYSNLNYILAGMLVEQVSGQAYGAYVAQHIFQPLAMRHSHVTRAAALADGLADGHHYMFRHAFTAKGEGLFGMASGGLIASAEDLAHFAIANLDGGRYGDAALLSAQGIAAMHTPPALAHDGAERYGMGWDLGDLDGTAYVGHSGMLYNVRTMLYLLPESHRAVVLLANASGFEQLLQNDQLARGVVALLEGRTPAPVAPPWQLPFLYWSIVLVPLLQVFGIYHGWRHWRDKGLGHALLVLLLYGGIAWLWLTWVPKATGIAILPGMRLVYPDLFYPLIVGVVLGIGWSLVYLARTLMRRRPT